MSRVVLVLIPLLLPAFSLLAGRNNSGIQPEPYSDCLQHALEMNRTHREAGRRIVASALSLDGSLMAEAIADSLWSTVAVFDAVSGRQLWRAEVGFEPDALELSPDGRVLAITYLPYSICNQPHMELREACTGIKFVSLENRAPSSSLQDDFVEGIAFSPDGTLVAAEAGSEIRLWDIATGKNHFSFETYDDDPDDTRPPRISSLSFSPDGKLLAGTGPDRKIFLWRVRDGRLLKGFRDARDREGYGTVLFSPDGKLLAAESFGLIRIWRASDGVLAGSLDTGVREFIVGFTQGDKRLITETDDERVEHRLEVWDVTRFQRGKPLFSYKLRNGSIGYLLSSVRIILSGPSEPPLEMEGVQLTDLDSGRKLSTLIMPERAPEPWFHQGAPQQAQDTKPSQ